MRSECVEHAETLSSWQLKLDTQRYACNAERVRRAHRDIVCLRCSRQACIGEWPGSLGSFTTTVGPHLDRNRAWRDSMIVEQRVTKLES
eukprot:5104562-Amphidinium_carterae.3